MQHIYIYIYSCCDVRMTVAAPFFRAVSEVANKDLATVTLIFPVYIAPVMKWRTVLYCQISNVKTTYFSIKTTNKSYKI